MNFSSNSLFISSGSKHFVFCFHFFVFIQILCGILFYPFHYGFFLLLSGFDIRCQTFLNPFPYITYVLLVDCCSNFCCILLSVFKFVYYFVYFELFSFFLFSLKFFSRSCLNLFSISLGSDPCLQTFFYNIWHPLLPFPSSDLLKSNLFGFLFVYQLFSKLFCVIFCGYVWC